MKPNFHFPGKGDFPELAAVWEASVRATHRFLAEEDLRFYRSRLASDYLPAVRLCALKDDDGRIAAFSGVNGSCLEMLFVRPDRFGKGAGRILLENAISEGVSTVDVNEQNDRAFRFYRRNGFLIRGRSAADGAGKPYPLLHLELRRGIRLADGTKEDIPALKTLFRETVLTVNRQDYTAGETEDWASCDDDRHWEELLARFRFILARSGSGLLGFSAVSEEGFIHSLFVGRACQREGIGRILLAEAEHRARQLGATAFFSEVSLTARPFFERQGYVVEAEQKRKANRLRLKNFRMRKSDETEKKNTFVLAFNPSNHE